MKSRYVSHVAQPHLLQCRSLPDSAYGSSTYSLSLISSYSRELSLAEIYSLQRASSRESSLSLAREQREGVEQRREEGSSYRVPNYSSRQAEVKKSKLIFTFLRLWVVRTVVSSAKEINLGEGGKKAIRTWRTTSLTTVRGGHQGSRPQGVRA